MTPGDIVATVGFASAEYLTLDLVCGYLGLVAVPLQHNATASRLQPIIAETEPQVLAINEVAGELDTEALAGLRRRVGSGADPRPVADAWLAAHPLGR